MEEDKIQSIIKEAKTILNTGQEWCHDDWDQPCINWARDTSTNYTPKRKSELVQFWNGYENAIVWLSTYFGDPVYSGRGAEYKEYWKELKIKPNVPAASIYNTIDITWWEQENRTIFISISTHDANTLMVKHIEIH
jgi:hypothetical protein